MDELSEIQELGGGKYSFIVGRQRYTLTTPLGMEKLSRIVSTIQSVLALFPASLSQEERLFLGVMFLAHKLDDVQLHLDAMNADSPEDTRY